MNEIQQSVLRTHPEAKEVYVVTPSTQKHLTCLVGQADAISNLWLKNAKAECPLASECGLKSVQSIDTDGEGTPYNVYGRVLVCLEQDCSEDK